MASFHSITGHLFNRNISKEELDKTDSLLSTLNQQRNLNISRVWTIDSKQAKKLKKLNALTKKMLHYRGKSQDKRQRIVMLYGDIRFLNAKLSGASSTPNSSPRPSCTPSSTTAQSNSELSHLHETSSTLSTASTARSSLELSEPPRYRSQGVRATTKPMPKKPLGAVRVSKPVQQRTTATNRLTELQSELNRKKAHYAFMEDQSQYSSQGYRDFERIKHTLTHDIRALERQVAVAKAGHPSISQPAVSRATHAPSRATQVTDASGNKNKIVQLNAKIVAKTNERRKLESEAKEGGWKEESRLKPKIRELKDEISSLQQELQALQSS